MKNAQVTNLEGLFEAVMALDNGERVSLGEIIGTIGKRTFGPLFLILGVVMVTPLSAIPGMPLIMAGIFLLVGGQLLLRRDHVWLPAWLLTRTVPKDRLNRALARVIRPARWIDSLVKPRLTQLTYPPGDLAIGIVCVAVGIVLPVTEFIPFTGTLAGWVLLFYGLALIGHDGLFAVFGHVAAAAYVSSITYALLVWLPNAW